MKRIIICLIVLFVFSGCVYQTLDVPKAPAEDKAEEPTPQEIPTEIQEPEEKEDEPLPDSYVLDKELKEQILAQLGPGEKSSMPLNFKRMEYGEAFTFGVGVQNTRNPTDDFLVDVYFDKAYDKYTNAIAVDKSFMNSWIKTNLEPFTLENAEKKIVAIVIEVGEIMEGVQPRAGTYIFDVETLYKGGGRYINKDFVGKREITIKI